MRPTTPLRFAACLALGLIPFLASCDSETAKEAGQKAKSAATELGSAAGEHLAAAGESAKAAGAAAKESLEGAADDLAAARDSAKQKLDEAADALSRFIADSKDDLVAQVEAELALLDARRDELAVEMSQVSVDAQRNLSLAVAKLDVKRKAFQTKLDELRAAAADQWAGLQPGIEERLATLEDELEAADARVEKALAEELPQGDVDWTPGRPKQLFEVVKVVDGDTIHIERDGKIDKLRLLSVDTEEKLSGQPYNPAKPETLYGEETKLWAQDLFAGLAGADGKTRVGVLFPEGVEEYDMYGRLLCHVVLPDGTDYNLQLVREGRSPYFMKYGYSQICHAAFEAAEAAARAEELGVWNPEVNKPANAADPWHKRDYDEVVPWWRARAEAIQAFRTSKASAPDSVFSSEDEDGLAAGVEASKQNDYPVSVFGAVERTFDEADGSLTVLFRALEGKTAFRAHIPAELRPEYAALELEERSEAGRQNYLVVAGQLERGPRGFDIWATDKFSLRLAGPEPGEEAASTPDPMPVLTTGK